jgi:hypothetical protein
MLSLIGGGWHGEAHRFLFGRQLIVKIQTAYIERQFSPQHLKEAQDVIRGLGKCDCNPADASLSDPGNDPRTCFVTGI